MGIKVFPHLVGELANAFYQILVGLPVPGDHLPQSRDHLETVGVIKSGKYFISSALVCQ